MMNYSPRKTQGSSKGKSLNERTKATQATHNNKYKGKPLIVPAHKDEQASKDEASKKVFDFDWLNILSRTFLSIYLNPNDDNVGAGKYDYMFDINGHRVYILVQHEDMYVDKLTVSETMLSKFKQRAATKLTKRFQQVKNKVNLPLTSTEQAQNDALVRSVHVVGLTALTVLHEGKSYPIAHEYGSQFFQEECVLDLDGDGPVMQLFSLGGFLDTIKLLQTPSDVISFLDYHLPILVEMEDYKDEAALAEQYFADSKFFKRALLVQRKLVDIGILGEVEPRLLNAAGVEKHPKRLSKVQQKNKDALLEKLQSYSRMYQKLINGVTKRRHQANDVLPLEQVKSLVDESMYTRMSIMEEVVAYANRSSDEHRQGYLAHQHSYNQFGRHYILVIYGTDEDAEYSKKTVSQNYSELLTDINSQLQDPVMSDYFVLGFDMSKQNKDGDLIVEMDVFHQPGAYMSETERRLYQQVQELNELTE